MWLPWEYAVTIGVGLTLAGVLTRRSTGSDDVLRFGEHTPTGPGGATAAGRRASGFDGVSLQDILQGEVLPSALCCRSIVRPAVV